MKERLRTTGSAQAEVSASIDTASDTAPITAQIGALAVERRRGS